MTEFAQEYAIRFAKIEAAQLAYEQAEADAAGITIWELRERRRAHAQRERELDAEVRVRDAVARAGIPSRHLVSDHPMVCTDAVTAVLTYDASLLILAGTVGCGKTFAAAVWMMLGGGRGLWVTAPELSRGYCYDAAAMDRVLNAPRLVVDDLGCEYLDQGGRYLATLAEILETRHARQMRTLLTTNCSADAFRDRYAGPRLASRIAQDGDYVWVAGPDLRRGGPRP